MHVVPNVGNLQQVVFMGGYGVVFICYLQASSFHEEMLDLDVTCTVLLMLVTSIQYPP